MTLMRGGRGKSIDELPKGKKDPIIRSVIP